MNQDQDTPSDRADPLSAEHRAYLNGHAITDAVIAAAGIFSAGADIVFPWRDGDRLTAQRRPWPGPPGAYYWEPGKPLHLAAWRPVAAGDGGPVILAEGTKQSLAVASWAPDGYAVYGMAGCRGWSHDGLPGAGLAALAEGRPVTVSLDADVSANSDVWDAADRLRKALLSFGAAEVRFLDLPAGAKNGIDDYLAAVPEDQRAAVLARLIASAVPKLPRRPAARNGPRGSGGSGVVDHAATSEPLLTSTVAGVAAVAATPLDGAALLDAVIGAITRFVAFANPLHAVAVALYAAATHAARELQVAPRLRVTSPVKRCGKTRLLQVLMCLVRKPLPTANASVAALVRSIGADPCTLVLDEMDAVFGKTARGDEKAEALRGILNAGFDHGAPYLRWNTETNAAESWPTFAMAIIAGIGELPDTVEDRAVIIPMARKTAGATVAKFRIRHDPPALLDLRARLDAWIGPQAGQIADARPAMPPGLSDRAEDVWEPLLAVADAAGGHWPGLARAAAAHMAAEAATADAESSTAVRLLADVREVLGDAHAMHSFQITARLAGLDGAQWAGWDHGRPLTDRQLADMLRPFGIRPKQVKINGVNLRGYYRAHFADAWSRYPTPDQGDTATAATPATPQVSNGSEVAAWSTTPLPPLPADPPAPYLAQPPSAPAAAPALPAGAPGEYEDWIRQRYGARP